MGHTSTSASATKNLFVICIGASAGALDSIKELITNLPHDTSNLAIVLAQHRSAEYATHIHELLKAKKPWTIELIENNTRLEAGHIYINPSGEDVWLKDGRWHLKTSEDATTATPSIDYLFETMAEHLGTHCIGIILSGSGHDGTEGCRHIKEKGGRVIAQDPHEAPFSSMPQAVIKARYADAVLSVSHMVADVESYMDHVNTVAQSPAETNHFTDILNMLSLNFGTDFSQYKPSTIKRRLTKRLDQLNIEQEQEYFQYLQKNPSEMGVLFETMLIGVTEFFRNPKVFETLRTRLEAMLEKKSAGDTIRIWSVGCSTGEEPFSLAILLYEILGDDVEKYTIQIFATDIDQRAISFARKAIYGKDNLANVPAELVRKYFYENAEKYELKKIIRQHVLFTKHDITQDPPFVKLDVVCCRNLLIYFDANLQKEVIPVLHYSLNPEGLLFLGKSENVSSMSDLFSVLDSRARIFQKDSNAEINTLRFSSFRKNTQKHKDTQVYQEMSLEDITAETLTKTFEHPYVVLGEDMQTLLIKGSLQPYLDLSEGTLNSNILKILNPAIHAELRTCFIKAKKDKESCVSRLIHFDLRGEQQYLKLHIKPLLYAHNGKQHYLVIFNKVEKSEHFSLPEKLMESTNASNVIRIMELEQELEATREHLKAFTEELEVGNEELQAVNEELQSANEELKSTNEELETSNEELQSANEELQTANSELGLSHQMMIAKEEQLLKTKEDLEVAKERFETALKNSNIFIGYQNKNLQYYWYYNNASRYDDIMITGQNDLDILGQKGQHLTELKRQVLIKGTEIREEIKMDGYYWDVSLAPIYKDGEVNGVKTVAVDITTRKKALKKEQRSYDIIDAVLDDIKDMLLVVDTDLNVLAINQAQATYLKSRYGLNVHKGDNLHTSFKDNPHAIQRTYKLLTNILQGEKVFIEKLKIEEPEMNDFPRYFKFQGFPLYQEDDEVEGAIIVSTDITHHVNTENQIEHLIRHTSNLHNEEFFEDITDQLYSLFGATHIFFARPDQEHKKAQAVVYRKDGQKRQPFTYTIHGSPTAELLQKKEILEFKQVAEQFSDDDLLKQWKADGYIGIPVNSPTTGEFLGIITMVHTGPIHSVANAPYLFRIMAMRAGAEIETNRNVQALKDREEQLQNITKNLPEMIYEYISTDDVYDDRFTFVSEAVKAIYEVSKEDLLRNPQLAWDAIYEDDFAEFVSNMEHSGTHLTTMSWTGRIVGNQSYKIRWVKLTAKPERIDDRTVRWYGVISEISRIKQMEQELAHAKNRAEKLARAKEEFLAVMSHEIRTPLNGIMGITELMREEAEEESEYLSVLKFSADNLLNLINNILDFSKIEAGKVEVIESKTSLSNLLKNLEHSHNFKARENNNDLIFDIDETLPPVVHVDELKLMQILNNLLSNANKFTKRGEVRVKVEKTKESHSHITLCFKVQDTGIGIAARDIERIFERFEQLGSNDQRMGGTGLGLGIVKRLIEVMGSQLQVESEPGQGSTFSFCLKLKKAVQKAKTNSLAAHQKVLRVLVVDDMADHRELIKKYLSKNGDYHLLFAQNGNEAIEKIQQQEVDIILMDLAMPEMDGHEAAKKIRSKKIDTAQKTPIIALTTERMDISGSSYFDDLLPKPVSSKELRDKLEKYRK